MKTTAIFREPLPSIQLGSSYGAVVSLFLWSSLCGSTASGENQVDFHALGILQRWAGTELLKSIPRVIQKLYRKSQKLFLSLLESSAHTPNPCWAKHSTSAINPVFCLQGIQTCPWWEVKSRRFSSTEKWNFWSKEDPLFSSLVLSQIKAPP